MAGKRAPMILALVAVLAVGLLLMFFSQEGDRAGRRGASDGRGAGTGVDPATGASAEDKAAYEVRLKEILEKYGARNGTGAVYLTKPKAPGAGLRVTVRAEIDGFRLEAEAYADKAGGFSFASLPGVDGYSLEIAGDRVQPYRRDGIALSAGGDLGTHDVDRWYFVKGRVVGQGASGLKGAKVALVTPSGSGGRFNFLDLALSMKEPDPAIAETKTTGQGRFEFRLKTPGTYGLRVRAEGWATHYRSPAGVPCPCHQGA